MSLWKYFIVCVVIDTCCALDYLRDKHYNLMPPLFYADDYKKCVTETDWVYCMVNMNIVPDERSQLSTMIQDYSKHYKIHYNHSTLTRGVCVKKTCAKYSNTVAGVTNLSYLEDCLKEKVWQKYELKAILVEPPICSSQDDKLHINSIDVIIYSIFVLIIILNVVGTMIDFYNKNRKYIPVSFLKCFSFSNNLKLLFESRNKIHGNEMICTKSLDGIRSISMMYLLFTHSSTVYTSISSNTWFIEQLYEWSVFYLVLNGHFVVNVFFILSSFLLVYNKQYAASGIGNIKLILNHITTRFLRLTPPYAAVLAFNITCLKLFYNSETQPFWKITVGEEIRQCKKYYILHLLYANNYHLEIQCMCQTWYIAAEMQLYVLGVTVCVLTNKPVVRTLTLAALFVVGLLLPALITYYHELQGVLLCTLESYRTSFTRNHDFHYMYRPGYTNLSCFMMGMALAHIVTHLQKTNFNTQKYKKYTPIYWATLPLIIITIIIGKLFYLETSGIPMWVRVTTAVLYKPLFGFLISIIIFGQLFKFEQVYSRVLGWSGWTPISRVSYCVYLTQMTIIRLIIVNHRTFVHSSVYLMVINFFVVLVTNLLAALVLWLTIEAPFSNLVRIYVTPHKIRNNKTKIH